MLQHEIKVNLQQLWEDEWEDEELSDAQLKNICGGTGSTVPSDITYVTIITAGSENNTTNPEQGPGIYLNDNGLQTVTRVNLSDPGSVQDVMTLNPEDLTVTITGLGLQANP